MKNLLSIISLIIFLLSSNFSFSQDRTKLNNLFERLDTVSLESRYEAAIYQNIGIQYVYINLDSSAYYTKIAIEKFEKLDIFTEVINATTNLAIAYYQSAEIDKAIDVMIEILPRVEQSGDKYWQGRCYNTLGELCRSAEYFDRAMGYLIKSKKIFKEIGNSGEYAACCNRIAAIYYEIKDFNLAIVYADSSLRIAEEQEREDFIVLNLDIIAASYKDIEQYDDALAVYERIIKIYGEDNDAISANVLRNISELYYKIEDYKKSIEYGLIAYNRAKNNNTRIYIENSAAILSKAYSKSENYERAFFYSEISKNTYHEIFNEEKNAQIAELNTKYETEKKEKEITQQKNEIINNKLELKQKQILNYTLGLGIFLTIIIFIITLFNRLKLKRLNSTLTNKNYEIEQQNEEISQQAENLKSANEKLEELDQLKQGMTGMLVHDLKNPISTILSLSQNNEISSASKQMLNMVSNILDVQKYEETKMVLDTKSYSLYTISTQSVAEIRLLAKEKNIEIQNNITTNTFINTDEEILNRIFINLLTNAIKYTPENGKVTITCKKDVKNSDFIKVSIIDNGIGIQKDKLNSVFDKFSQVMAKKSGHARSTGLGLAFCKMTTEAHGGKISVASIPNEETVFTFTLPISKKNKDSEDANIVYNKEEKLQLNKKEEKYLSQFIEQYRKYEIFDILPVRKITENVDESFSVNIKIWKERMQKIVYNTNEIEYNSLILL